MQEVRSIKGVVAAWISNYYLSQNKAALVQSSWALHKCASGQYVLNWCYPQKVGSFSSLPLLKAPSSITPLSNSASGKISLCQSTEFWKSFAD
jgi:hypothetical protein